MCGQTGAGRQVITVAHSEPLAKRRLRERERERERGLLVLPVYSECVALDRCTKCRTRAGTGIKGKYLRE